MISLLLDTKKCMSELLLRETFHKFLLVEGEITTFSLPPSSPISPKPSKPLPKQNDPGGLRRLRKLLYNRTVNKYERGARMNEFITKRYELLAQKVIKGLESRNMSGYYAKDRGEALDIALSLIPEGSSVTMGGCVSAAEIGLVDAVKNGNYNFIDRFAFADRRAAALAAYDADVFLASANAMTEDGVIINIDGNANRVSAIANGPKKVIFIVGINKLCPDVDSAMKRARNVAAPVNAQRFGLDTPCSKTGSCMNCKSPDTICCQILIQEIKEQWFLQHHFYEFSIQCISILSYRNQYLPILLLLVRQVLQIASEQALRLKQRLDSHDNHKTC